MRSHAKISHRPTCLAVTAVKIQESTTILNGCADKPFPCAYCPLRLKNIRRLEEHTRVHTGKSMSFGIVQRIIIYLLNAFFSMSHFGRRTTI